MLRIFGSGCSLHRRSFSQRRKAPIKSDFDEWKVNTCRKLTRAAPKHDGISFEIEGYSVAEPAPLDLNAQCRTSSARLLALHPFLPPEFGSDGSSKGRALENECHRISTASRSQLQYLFNSSRAPTVRSDFVHADIIVKRNSKQQLSLLVDMHHFPLKNLAGIYLSPVETVVSRSSLSRVKLFDHDLYFPNLYRDIMSDAPIHFACTRCKKTHAVVENSIGDSIVCKTPLCVPSTNFSNPPTNIHPGGNRHYWGPVVPDLRNIWIGTIDQLTHRNGRVGILTTSIFRLFKDPAIKSSKITLSGPDPRVQWTVLPIITV
jgi:hypothetical protein